MNSIPQVQFDNGPSSAGRRLCLQMGLAGLLAHGGAVRAQGAYPTKNIRLVVPFPAGNALDVGARAFALGLSQELGQQVIVDNRVGATGHIGGEAVARAPADGYTLLFTASSTQVVSPQVMRLPYKPMDDLAPVALIAVVENLLVVHKDVPVHSVAELIAYAKANPGKMSYASYGLGSNAHLAGEMLGQMAGLQMVHVPYSSGQLIPDLLAGRVNMQIANIQEVEQHVKSGALRALAVTSRTRMAAYPQLPAMAETLPGYAVGAWGMLMAPAKTPAPILEKLNAVSVKVLARPEVRDVFEKQRFMISNYNLAQTRDFLDSEWVRWERVVREAKVPMVN